MCSLKLNESPHSPSSSDSRDDMVDDDGIRRHEQGVQLGRNLTKLHLFRLKNLPAAMTRFFCFCFEL